MTAPDEDDEDHLLRSVALQNAHSILLARQRSEAELIQTKDALRESQERLRAALSAAGTGTFRWNLLTNTVQWDGSLERLFGIEPGRTIQSHNEFIAAVHDDDRAAVLARSDQSARDGSDLDIEFRVVWPDGSVHWIDEKAKAFFDPEGHAVYMTGACTDITSRKQAEVALREETRILERLNETGKALASTLELHALIQGVTDAATELSGGTVGAFFYKPHAEHGDGFTLYTLSGPPREAFETFGNDPVVTARFSATFHGAPPIRCADVGADGPGVSSDPHRAMPGQPTPIRSYLAVPVTSRSGEIVGGLFFGHPEPNLFTERAERLVAGVAAQAGIAIDNARLYEAAQHAAEERKLLLESERAARSEAERMSALKDEFLATLSHELRTPLNAILGWSQLLKRVPKDPSELVRGLDTIERNARVQAQLIEDLLDMSRVTSGKLRLDVQTLRPVSFVEAAIETVQPAADAKGIRLERLLDPSAGPISGDPNRLQQVIWNLLSNAIKFTPKDGKVQILLERVSSHIEITIADTGAGIRADFIPHLFERFRQGDASTTRRHGGLGLGLSIVKSLVELHGGTVSAKSPGEGLGTTMIVNLPLSAVHRRASGDARSHPTAFRTADGRFNAIELAGVKVLVVDDQADARDLIKRVLEDCAAEVVTAASAEEALHLIGSTAPDVLITDIGMPDADGFELLDRVRALGRDHGGRTPAIALTAFARSEDRTRALRAGFLAHVAKPVDPSELVATVASVARRSRP